MEMNAATLLVRALEAEGVRRIYGVPGEETLELLEALRTSAITFVPTRHEQHAAFMAATYGRLTGRAGVCLATLGPGATNLVTGIAHAQLGGFPLVALTGQKAVRGNLEGAFQLLDVVGTMRPLTKWATSLASVDHVPRGVRHAFQTAETPRPGAVHLELPQDVAASDASGFTPHLRLPVHAPRAAPSAIEEAAREIAGARRPIVLVGGGGNDPRVAAGIEHFLESTGLFAVTTQNGKGAVNEANEHSLFALGIHKLDYAHVPLRRADLVLTVGYDIVEHPPSVWNEGRDKRIVHMGATSAVPDTYYAPELEVVGDVEDALGRLGSALADRAPHDASLSRLRGRVAERLFESICETCFPPSPMAIVYAVREVLDERDVVSLDNGIFKVWFARMYQVFAPHTLLLDNALATMGAGLAMAMEARLVRGDARSLAVVGDGGFLMNLQDLETAVRLEQDLTILVLRDDAYGFIRWKQRDEGLPDYGMTFGNPDFVALARSFGAAAHEVASAEELIPTLRRALDEPGVSLVTCPIDYSHNEELSRDRTEEIEAMLK